MIRSAAILSSAHRKIQMLSPHHSQTNSVRSLERGPGMAWVVFLFVCLIFLFCSELSKLPWCAARVENLYCLNTRNVSLFKRLHSMWYLVLFKEKKIPFHFSIKIRKDETNMVKRTFSIGSCTVYLCLEALNAYLQNAEKTCTCNWVALGSCSSWDMRMAKGQETRKCQPVVQKVTHGQYKPVSLNSFPGKTTEFQI